MRWVEPHLARRVFQAHIREVLGSHIVMPVLKVMFLLSLVLQFAQPVLQVNICIIQMENPVMAV